MFHHILGVVNGPSKNARLAKMKPNSRGLVVSYFYGGPSRSLDFFFNAKEVSGSQKMYQSRRLAKSRIYHSTPLIFKHLEFRQSASYCHPLLFSNQFAGGKTDLRSTWNEIPPLFFDILRETNCKFFYIPR